ncbi:ABC transporter substrate-binding protein [Acidisphaera rubrifaciens]|uniref:ABC transporter toluene transporter auxiliary component Ttg1D/Ttg2D n=1 Tax=Acidisphaera rubrifaciens HS-AP3 TaxID=1231350 RepID=A0A0D6P514_9PROT|nr:ABC transporter substrate-binding protein [Acidisphaera rubrifaciens]GAN76283.1 ABC transporter toluene transporter auxiliary component Ttg1D/Ttg2D [Acidisphaera rubrifaciens HS-AP3]
MITTRRRAALRLAGLALAGLVLPLGPAHAAPDSDVTAPVAQFQAALSAVMKASGASFAQRYDMLAPVVERVFDLAVILRACVGPRWQSFSPDQQAALGHVFAQFTTASWIANFTGDSGARFEILPDLRSVGADQIVQTRILVPGREGHRIDFQMRQETDGWRVVDVLLDGTISRVAVQRSDFRRYVAENTATPLINVLRKKVADLSGGSLPS